MLSGLLALTGGDAFIMGYSVTKEPPAAKASLGLDSAWMPTLMILVYTLGFFVLAVWPFRKMGI